MTLQLKIFAFTIGRKTTKHSANITINTEKVFSYVCLILILGIVISQIANPFLESFTHKEGNILGKPLGQEEFLYLTGVVSLKLEGAKQDENLKILVNGNEVGGFENSIMKISVKEDDVLEICGDSVASNITVNVIEVSPQINKSKFKNVRVTGGIQILGKVEFLSP